ncbi:MAG: DUF3124 domain-containing protein [Bacteroidota bacterium]
MTPKKTLWLTVAIVVSGIIALFTTSLIVDAKIEANKEEIAKLGEINMSSINELERSQIVDISAAYGEEIYVPVYSQLQGPEGRRNLRFSINLSIRNTDPEDSLRLQYIDFYDTNGNIVRKFGDGPIDLGPMATKQVHIKQSDPIGGVGANFYLQWTSPKPINEPIVEAVMLGGEGTMGYSWLTKGQVVKLLNVEGQ